MTPVTQTKVVVKNSKGENIVHGNCFPAAIASMLDLPITEVPNIEVFFDTSFDYKWLMNAWLRERFNLKIEWAEEYEIFHLGFESGDDYSGKANNERLRLSDNFYLAIGPSPRGVDHVCIYQGGELIHDPHPTRDGLLKVERFQKIIPLAEGDTTCAPKTAEADKPVEPVKEEEKDLITSLQIAKMGWKAEMKMHNQTRAELAAEKAANALHLKRIEELTGLYNQEKEAHRIMRKAFQSSSEQHQQIEQELRGRITDLIAEVVSNSEEAAEYCQLLEELKNAKTYTETDRIIATIPALLNKFTNKE